MRQTPREIRDLITVAPMPRTVHPERDRGRRRARAATILKRSVSFVDAAAYRGVRAYPAVVVDSKEQITNCASVRTDDTVNAEQVAIALVILDGERDVIYSDSMSAIGAFESGVVSEKALRVLRSGGRDGIKHYVLIWFSALVLQVKGAPSYLNESAHKTAPVPGKDSATTRLRRTGTRLPRTTKLPNIFTSREECTHPLTSNLIGLTQTTSDGGVL